MSLVFLLYPSRKSWSREHLHWIDAVLAVVATALPLYIVVFYKDLVLRAGMATPVDVVIGGLGILMVIEAARRVVGWPLITVALLFIAYAFTGPYIPGTFGHRGVELELLVDHLYFTTEGVFGIPLGVSATFIFLFILLGAWIKPGWASSLLIWPMP
jgi:TRAP-type uncharacterized transport system fused permease subunit